MLKTQTVTMVTAGSDGHMTSIRKHF